MKAEEIREGDIVEIDYITEFAKEHINEGKALVIWKGFNNQPLVRKLNTKAPIWTCYEHIARVVGHIDIVGYMDKALSVEPCEDCISREDALMALTGDITDCTIEEFIARLRTKLSKLPPVTSKEKTGWIPVSERLPKAFRYVNCTCHSLIDDREDWVVETCYIPQPQNSPYSDWGNIPMLNHGECEVVAWMYREIPEPYKAESE